MLLRTSIAFVMVVMGASPLAEAQAAGTQAKPAATQARPAPQTKPAAPETKPGASETKPGAPVTKPGAPVTKPGTPMTKPGTPVTKSPAAQAEPAAPLAKPAATQSKGAAPRARPAGESAKAAPPSAGAPAGGEQAASSGEVPAASKTTPKAAGSDAAAAAAVNTDQLVEPAGFAYSPEARRDPFVSLLRRGSTGRASTPIFRAPGLGGLSVDEITLRGTVRNRESFVGIAQGADQKTYIVRAGDKLLDGTIRAISQNDMLIVQQVNDPLSLEKQREVRKVLRQIEAK